MFDPSLFTNLGMCIERIFQKKNSSAVQLYLSSTSYGVDLGLEFVLKILPNRIAVLIAVIIGMCAMAGKNCLLYTNHITLHLLPGIPRRV